MTVHYIRDHVRSTDKGAPEPVTAGMAEEEQMAYDKVVGRVASTLARMDERYDGMWRYATSVLGDLAPDIAWLESIRPFDPEAGTYEHDDWQTDVCREAERKFRDSGGYIPRTRKGG